jgi:hypothetical protein
VLRQLNRLVLNKPAQPQTLLNLIIRQLLKVFNRLLRLVRLELRPRINRFSRGTLKASNMQILRASFILKLHLLHRLIIKRQHKVSGPVFNMLVVLICQLYRLRCRLRGKLLRFKLMVLALLQALQVPPKVQMRRRCVPQWALNVRRNRFMVQRQA